MSSTVRSPISFPARPSPDISKCMHTRARPPGSVIAAGAAAIFGGALVSFLTLFSVLLLSRTTLPASTPGISSEIRPLAVGGLLFFFACGAFVALVGAYVLFLRNWARIALLLIAGCELFFGVIGIGVIFFTLFVAPPEPGVSKPVLAAVLAFIYGVPVLVALWWLILFTRRSVVSVFKTAAASQPERRPSSFASLFNNPRCPLAMRIVGWYLASFILFLPVLPFLPARIPAVLFARIFHGPGAFLLYFVMFTFIAVPGIGLLLLRRWSFPLVVAGQLLTILNVIVTVFSPSFESTV